MLTLIGLTKIYETKGGRRVAALSDVSLSFPERGLVFVIGKSGSGKSTLLNILGGLDLVDVVDLLYAGEEGKGCDEHTVLNLGLASEAELKLVLTL